MATKVLPVLVGLGLWSLVMGLVGGCGDNQGQKAVTALSGRLVVTGSSTMAPMVAAMAKQFTTKYPDVLIQVRAGGSLRGISDCRQGLNDIGMVSRALHANEGDLLAYPLGKDGACLIIHKDNPVASLSSEQVVAIFSGQISNWREAGGHNAPITVVARPPDRPTQELFEAFFHVDYQAIKPSLTAGDNAEAIKAVVQDPRAIAPISVGEAERNLEFGAPIKLLPLNGVTASKGQVRDGSFPITRTLNLITKGNPSRLAEAFMAFARSPEGIKIIESYDFVPLEQ
ncbi:MAG: phosphate ABC transporter substrate-binding protein [Desulfarculus sp.]|nr:phosphate ABC transporter substrate-binding protein [Desulfarculus sp.]